MTFENKLKKYKKRKITLLELEELMIPNSYEEFADSIKKCIEDNKLQPVRNAKQNGRHPALYKAYWIIDENDENEKTFLNELLILDARLSNDYYLHNLKQYALDREYVLRINTYYKSHAELFKTAVSLNERSFSLFYREKFLTKEQGRRILKNLGLTLEELNCYETCEPLAYYCINRVSPQNVLIIENKDTYFTFRRALQNGKNNFGNICFSTLIYGAGKGIYRSISDLKTSVEPYVADMNNHLFYFGDLDYEGIMIYEKLLECTDRFIEPFVWGYEKMLEKAQFDMLPQTKEKQNRNINGTFFTYFGDEIIKQMNGILTAEQYIPQEIITCEDLE